MSRDNQDQLIFKAPPKLYDAYGPERLKEITGADIIIKDTPVPLQKDDTVSKNAGETL